VIPNPTATPTLTVEDTGRLFGISRASAYEAVRAGTIPSIRLGRRIVVPTAAVLKMLSLETDRLGSDAGQSAGDG
jgi:excisionase family DNA binding protein